MPERIDLGRIEDRLRISIDQLHEGVQVIGRDWTYLYLNESAARHGQRHRADLIGRTMTEAYPGIDQTEAYAAIRRVMEGGPPETLRSEFVFPTQERRWFDLMVEPVPDGVCVISLDVTDKQRMETAIYESEERTRFALKAARMGVWQLSLPGGEMYWSATMAEVAGVDPGLGPSTLEGFLSWVEPEDRQSVQSAVESAISGADGEFSVEFRLAPPGAPRRWVAGHGRLVRDAAGSPERLIGVGIDIQARRSAEQQLQHAQKMEAVGRLAGGVAHDFNNQLTAILGYCDLAIDAAGAGPDLIRDLKEIQAAAQRASTLTRQLLAFSRRPALLPKPIDLNQLIADVCRLLARVLGANVDVVLTLDPAVGSIRGDAGQIESVITNIAINARDAMAAGGRLTLATSSTDAPGDDDLPAGRYTVLCATDTGHGMDESTRARIFEPFFTTKDPGKGTGLGLSTVYGIVQQMQGRIRVESAPGRGTTFRIFFPATSERPAAVAEPAREPRPAQAWRILVVEDDQAIREFAARALTGHGYQVVPAASAEQALDIIHSSRERFDLLLLDIFLPGQTGLELMLQVDPPIPSLLMSGYADRHMKDQTVGATVQLLEKPFSARQLLRRVREVLRARDSAAAR